MATIIKKSGNASASIEADAYLFEDVSQEALRRAEEARQQAAAEVARARREADELRRRSEEEGRRLGIQSGEQILAEKIDAAMSSLRDVVGELEKARHAWLDRWEKQAVHLAAKMAQRILRRELERQPQITLDLVREALEMSAAAPQLRICLNPADAQTLGDRVAELIREIAPAAKAEIVASPNVSRGGCRVETSHGVIDQQIETQLDRIVAELTA